MITIIILLILAGVTLSLTLGDNGIITQAQKAKAAQEIAAIKEDFQLAILDKELEKGGTGLTQEELEEIAGNYGELQEDGNTIKTDEGYEIKIDEIYQPGGGTSGGGSGASDEELAALEEKIKELEQTVEDLTNTKTELEGTIEDLNKQLEEEQGNNAELQKQIENLTGQVDTLNKTKEQLEATISDLNTQIADLKAKQATGNATVADVLQNKTFSNSTQTGLTGTMANRGTLNWAPSNSTSYNIPAGYYSGGTISTANAYNTGYNAGNTAGYNNGYGAGFNSRVLQAYNLGSSVDAPYGLIQWSVDTAGWYVFIYGGSVRFTGSNKSDVVVFRLSGGNLSHTLHWFATAYNAGGGGFAMTVPVYCNVGDVISAQLTGENTYSSNDNYFQTLLGMVRMPG